MGLHCVNCGSPVNALYIQYSPGNVRLTKCAKCKAVADEYIECEMMILLIDLILQKTKAYRHLFFNMPHLKKYDLQGLVWKAALLFLLLDACIRKLAGNCCWIQTKCIRNCLGALYPCCLQLGRNREICMAVILSSYFKIFMTVMMVWDFPSSTVFIIDVFVLSSNVVAVKVVTNATTVESVGISFIGYFAKFFLDYM